MALPVSPLEPHLGRAVKPPQRAEFLFGAETDPQNTGHGIILQIIEHTVAVVSTPVGTPGRACRSLSRGRATERTFREQTAWRREGFAETRARTRSFADGFGTRSTRAAKSAKRNRTRFNRNRSRCEQLAEKYSCFRILLHFRF